MWQKAKGKRQKRKLAARRNSREQSLQERQEAKGNSSCGNRQKAIAHVAIGKRQ
ncbi:hypothetical protein L8106_00420 [Lyngbya sp. PCC 8106]|nr:hypothetical protein L8106_00420 [Lyngbya sp. PCC 8106]